MYALLVFLASGWSMIIAVIVLVIVLAFAAYFLKNWKVAAVGLLIVATLYGWQHAFVSGVQAEVAREKARLVELYENRITLANQLADDYRDKVLRDAIKIDELEKLASETPANTSVCFDIDTTRRVRGIN